MDGSNDTVEIKPIDIWNSRALVVIIFGFVYYHMVEAAVLFVETNEGTTADAKLVFFGVIVASGLIALAISLVATARVFYSIMASQREMIGAVWELLKKAWRLR